MAREKAVQLTKRRRGESRRKEGGWVASTSSRYTREEETAVVRTRNQRRESKGDMFHSDVFLSP